MSDLVGNPEDRFSHNEAQILHHNTISIYRLHINLPYLHIVINAYILHDTSVYAMIPSLAEALANRSQGGRVIEPARYEYPTSTPILPTNAGYDQPPPSYDVVAADTVPGEQFAQAGLPSYYDLYKDEEVKTDETGTQGNTSEETNNSDTQESIAATNRADTQNL